MNRGISPYSGVCGFILSAMLACSNTHATENQPQSSKPKGPPDKGRLEFAMQLFEEATEFRRKGRHADACKSYLASYAEYPLAMSAFQLGKCHEARGETVSAQRMFEIVAKLSRELGKTEAAEEALERAQSLESRHSIVVINVAPEAANTHYLSVFLDGALVLPTDWNRKRIPLDAGAHEIRAAAPHYKNYDIRFVIEATTSARHVDIPGLVRRQDTPGSMTVAPAPTSPKKERILFGTFGTLEAIGVVLLFTSVVANAVPDKISENARAVLGFTSLPFIVGGGIGLGWGYDTYRTRIDGRQNAAIIPRIGPSRIGFDLNVPF